MPTWKGFKRGCNNMAKRIQDQTGKMRDRTERSRDRTEGKREKKKGGEKNKTTSVKLERRAAADEEPPVKTLSRELLLREEELLTSGGLCDEDKTQLSQDLDHLWTHIRLEVQKSFGPDLRAEALRAAVQCVLDQDQMDERWSSSDHAPAWRPKRALQIHNELLQNMVQDRLLQRPPQAGQSELQGEKDDGESEELCLDQTPESVPDEVRRVGEQMRQDLLYIESTVSPCYPDHMDILNVYVKLYHSCFSSRLEQLAASPLDESALHVLLHWVNHKYRSVLMELQGKVDAESLSLLLPSDVLQTLQDQYLNIRQSTTQEWMERALTIEVESWSKTFQLKQDTSYCHSPLASDVLQVLESSKLRLSFTGTDRSSQSFSAHLDSFLSSYVKAVEDFVEGDHGNVPLVLKAQLVCEEQFREFVLRPAVDDETREGRLKSLDALRDCGYYRLTRAICSKVKELLVGLWTGRWLDGSLLVVDSLLDFVDQQLESLHDLKPSCAQWLLGRLHRDVALRYITNLLKTKRRSQSDQMRGACRMKEDVNKMAVFFAERGAASSRVTQVLLHVAEILGLKDPDSIQLELISLVQISPDIRADHVSRLLLLKALPLRSIRSIRRSVKENRPLEPAANHSSPFFSLLKDATLVQSVSLWLRLHVPFIFCC